MKVGNVVKIEEDPEGNATLATIEIKRKFAPIRRDARFSLRQKSIIGETYVDMTVGTRNAAALPEDGVLRGPKRVQESTQVDEILDSFDPYTRGAFQTWQQDLGAGIVGRGVDLNDALGTLPNLVREGRDLTRLLDAQQGALRGVVKNGGLVFDALSRNQRQLSALVRNQNTVFSSIQRERQAFADIWEILPTFLVESRLTLSRLQRFAKDTDPLVVQLRPAFQKLRPTLQDLGALSPDLRRFFANSDPYIDLAQRSLPATREISAACGRPSAPCHRCCRRSTHCWTTSPSTSIRSPTSSPPSRRSTPPRGTPRRTRSPVATSHACSPADRRRHPGLLAQPPPPEPRQRLPRAAVLRPARGRADRRDARLGLPQHQHGRPQGW